MTTRAENVVIDEATKQVKKSANPGLQLGISVYTLPDGLSASSHVQLVARVGDTSNESASGHVVLTMDNKVIL